MDTSDFETNINFMLLEIQEHKEKGSPKLKEFISSIETEALSAIKNIKQHYQTDLKSTKTSKSYTPVLNVKNYDANSTRALNSVRESMLQVKNLCDETVKLHAIIKSNADPKGKGQSGIELTKFLSQKTTAEEKNKLINKNHLVKKLNTSMIALNAKEKEISELSAEFTSNILQNFKHREFSSMKTKVVSFIAAETVSKKIDQTKLSSAKYIFAHFYDVNTHLQNQGFIHMEKRLKLAKVAFEVCSEHAEELAHYKICDQFKADERYGTFVKTPKDPLIADYEFAHASLIPQIGITNLDSTDIVYRCRTILNPDVKIAKIILNEPGEVELSQMLNCTDYLPWFYNAIDDYCECYTRSTMVGLMNKVIDKSISSEEAFELLNAKMRGCFNQLKSDLQNRLPTNNNGQSPGRFYELADSYWGVTN